MTQFIQLLLAAPSSDAPNRLEALAAQLAEHTDTETSAAICGGIITGLALSGMARYGAPQ